MLGLNTGGIREHFFPSKPQAQIQSIVVLPLINLSSDPAQDYFTEGMTEELTTDLGKISALRVFSRTSAMQSPLCAGERVELFYDWDWFAAEEEFKQTMKFNPNHAQGLPLAFPWTRHSGPDDLASERAQELLELAPTYVWGHFELAQVYDQQGKLEEAAQESLKADELFGTDPQKVAQLKEAMAKSGAQGYWRLTLENYRESAKSSYVPSVLVAEACVRVGDRECAFEWLEQGFEERDDLMINLKVERVFDPLRSDPRFKDLIRRVGISQ